MLSDTKQHKATFLYKVEVVIKALIKSSPTLKLNYHNSRQYDRFTLKKIISIGQICELFLFKKTVIFKKKSILHCKNKPSNNKPKTMLKLFFK